MTCLKIRIRNLYFKFKNFYPVKIKNKNFKCDPYHINFWKSINNKKWENETFDILSKFLKKDSIYCDIGAWIGPTVIYAAKKCKLVYCFEPDQIAYEYLLSNIRLNNLKNIIPFNVALSNTNDIKQMTSLGTEPGDSMTSLLKNNSKNSINVYTMKWENWLAMSKIKKLDFLKIDIEGGEFIFLETIKNYLNKNKPIVYLSTHCPYLDKNIREKELDNIIEILKCSYSECFDELNNKITIDSIKCLKTLNEFRSFLFLK